MRLRTSSAVALTSSPGATRFISRRIIPRFCMSARTACGDARVLDLDRDLAAVVQRRAVDLADRGGGDRLLVEVGEDLVERLLELGLDHLAHVVEAHLRRRVAQLAELALELLAVLLGHQADVEEREHLAELHRRALHRPQRGDDLLGGLDVAALERVLARLLAARQVRGLGAELARALAGGEAGDPRGAGDARGRDAVLRPSPRMVSGRGRGARRRRRGLRRGDRGRRRRGGGVGVGVGVGVGRGGRGSASACASRPPPGVSVGVGVGVASRSPVAIRAAEERRRVRAVAAEVRRRPAAREAVTNTTAQREGEQAGDERERPLAAGQLAARLVDRAARRPRRQLRRASSGGGGASGSNASSGSTHRGLTDGVAVVRFATAPTVSTGRRSNSVTSGHDDRRHRGREHACRARQIMRDEEGGGGARGGGDQERLERQSAAALLAWLRAHAPPR